MRTPSAYAKATAAVDRAAAAGLLSHPAIQYREAAGIPYLVACCKEGMRLHPSVGWTLPRRVPPGGRTVAGVWFAEGTRVGVNAAVVHRDKKVFGEDADEFVPERWFREDALNMERYMFQVRACNRGARLQSWGAPVSRADADVGGSSALGQGPVSGRTCVSHSRTH
jgi:cytochrome P450